MPQPVTFRVVVRHPLPGVELRVQRGRDELVPPVARTDDAATFEFRLEADARSDGRATLRYSILRVVIGDGIACFAGLDRDVAPHLLDVKACRSGTVGLRYEVKRPDAPPPAR